MEQLPLLLYQTVQEMIVEECKIIPGDKSNKFIDFFYLIQMLAYLGSTQLLSIFLDFFLISLLDLLSAFRLPHIFTALSIHRISHKLGLRAIMEISH